MPKTDQELIALTLEDSSWYKEIIIRYEDKLIRYIRRICHTSKEDAEDILQEVFIKTYINLNSFDQSLSFSSWIYRIAHNEAVSHLRKLSSRPRMFFPGPESPIFNTLRKEAEIQERIDEKYFKEHILSILDIIDDKYKDVLILRYMEDKDYKEISDILKKPMGTVSTLINRAKKQLKAELIKNNIKPAKWGQFQKIL